MSSWSITKFLEQALEEYIAVSKENWHFELETGIDMLSFLFSNLFQDRETPLHIAVRTKNVEMVNLLLDHGASTDAIDKVCPHSFRLLVV